MIIVVLRWLWVNRVEDPAAVSLTHAIVGMQLYVFLGCTLFSLIYASFAPFFPEEIGQVTVIPEILILVGGGYFFARHLKRNKLPLLKSFVLQLKRIAGVIAVCLLGWAVTVGFGYVIYYIIFFLSSSRDHMAFVIIVTGLVWFASVMVTFRILRTQESAKNIRKAGMKKVVLFPVLIAYFMLMVPFMVQEGLKMQQELPKITLKKL